MSKKLFHSKLIRQDLILLEGKCSSRPYIGLRHVSKQRDKMPQTPPFPAVFGSSGYNSNLYQTKEENYSGLYYHDNNLMSGSLEALIQHLVPTVTYYPDRTYIFTFLLSSRLFIHPHELMTKVCQLCTDYQKLSDQSADKMRIRKLAPKILQLLTEWTETFPYDFRDERTMKSLKELTNRLSTGDETTVQSLVSWCAETVITDVVVYIGKAEPRVTMLCDLGLTNGFRSPFVQTMFTAEDSRLCHEVYRKAVQQMMQTLIRKLTTHSQYEENLAKINATVPDRLTVLKTKPQSIQRDILTICNDTFILAQQLTHIELERLSYIGPEEFVQAFVQKDGLQNEKSCFTDRKKASNLEAYVEWFNRLSYLVATEICMPVKKKHRARVIEFFIDVARECFNIGNFNSLMAIISGMNMSPVSRLKKTWAKVKTAKFDILEHQMDPSSNFYNYRTALRGATQRSITAHSSREKIVIPFFSLLIKDIIFLNEGCAHQLPNGHVNYEKFWELAKQVNEFMTWKKVECPFEKDRKILHYLLTAPIFSEDALCQASYESEGPENNMEKDRWKSLRYSGEGESTWLSMQSRFLTAVQAVKGKGGRERVMDKERRFPHCDRICHITGFCVDQQNVPRPG
ncbi:Ras-GEF domain-containing family member 1B-A [Bagarius yarrelli]|uniref:Ras-GEF domain-containing family member 1B-A n=1 Tax=Bagarius yarrelli TaxID=175774 RepID=A0A556U829_BAGYA|nr:Ras-GEF domain-containing family member 1B-A [Bagarius yarrelli]